MAMQIQRGLVKYKDRSDIICTYGVGSTGIQYYFLDEARLSNGNIIVTTTLLEAVDPIVIASNVGVIDEDGNVVIECNNKSIKPISSDILLVEKAQPTSPNVLEAISLKEDPNAATKLVTTPATIKDNINKAMGAEGRFVFNDQFSEASIYDIDGNNLVNNEYYSFIGSNDKKIYFSKNTIDSEVDEYSLNQDGNDDEDQQPKLNVETTNVTVDVIEKALREDSDDEYVEEDNTFDNIVKSNNETEDIDTANEEAYSEEENMGNVESTDEEYVEESNFSDSNEYEEQTEFSENVVESTEEENTEYNEEENINIDFEDNSSEEYSEEDNTNSEEQTEEVVYEEEIDESEESSEEESDDEESDEEDSEDEYSEESDEEDTDSDDEEGGVTEDINYQENENDDDNVVSTVYVEDTYDYGYDPTSYNNLVESYHYSNNSSLPERNIFDDVTSTISNLVELNRNLQSMIDNYEIKLSKCEAARKKLVELSKSQAREISSLNSRIARLEADKEFLEAKVNALSPDSNDDLARVMADARNILGQTQRTLHRNNNY